MDEILSKCLQGQKWAWDAFVDRYGPVIFAAVRYLLPAHGSASRQQTAEDITQDVFLRLIRNDFRLLRNYDPDRASLVTWLTVVARSTTIDFLRRRQLTTVPLGHAPPLASPSAPSRLEPPTAQLPLRLLTARQRLVMHLLFDRQMDPAAIADLLGISAQAVRSTRHKAIQTLRKHFGV